MGIVTRCCTKFLEYCFESLGLNRIEGPMIPENTGSIAVAERLGFTYDGLRVRPLGALPEGPTHMAVYSITASPEKADR